ncbi:hypothetical protein F4780DRAFT_773825 [Xylariomycetidae sp. FL0641]|nr:hypothetical protein F4780DRAFT_773825 [Xylariomycetidae sp. FL0641]
MVGVPKSNRCTFCKSRKTKCDENWPRCGACARANRVCSGARSNYKFVVNGSHNELPSSSADDHGNARRHGGKSKAEDTAGGSKEPKWTLVHLREYTKGECSYHRMRIAQTKARPSEALSWPIVRPTDRLAVQLIQCLNSVPEKGLTILGSSLRMIPKQLESGSMALQSAVQLIVASWTNSRRDLHPGHWLDLKIYSNALRSLQDAVDGLSQESVTDTLAAQCILQKVEVVVSSIW